MIFDYKLKSPFIIIIFLILFFIAPGLTESKIYLDIYGPSLAKLPISIPPFRPVEGKYDPLRLSETLHQIISNDLSLSGFFAVIPYTKFMGDLTIDGITPDTIDRRGWELTGADLVLKGLFRVKNGAVRIDPRLLDIHQGKQIPIKAREGPISRVRLLIHQIADEIIEYYTGQEGIFSTKLAFISNASGFKELTIMDSDGANIRQLTFSKSITLSPSWSPKGDEIAYISYQNNFPALYSISLSKGTTRVISQRSGMNGPASWDPSGERLALTLTIDGNPELYIVTREGVIIKRLTYNNEIDVSPTWSPDGSKIAFVSNRSGNPQIYIIDLNTGQERRLTYEGKYNTTPSWSPRGDRIAFSGMIGGRHQIFIISPDGNSLQQLTDGSFDSESPTWSPDGRYIAFSSRREGPSRIYIMMANGQNVQRLSGGTGDHILPAWSPRMREK
jgi:TolB protein